MVVGSDVFERGIRPSNNQIFLGFSTICSSIAPGIFECKFSHKVWVLYIMFKKRFYWLNAARAFGAGVAQPGWSVRLIIERSRARIPSPARIPFIWTGTTIDWYWADTIVRHLPKLKIQPIYVGPSEGFEPSSSGLCKQIHILPVSIPATTAAYTDQAILRRSRIHY